MDDERKSCGWFDSNIESIYSAIIPVSIWEFSKFEVVLKVTEPNRSEEDVSGLDDFQLVLWLI